jgi:hypothetical protein
MRFRERKQTRIKPVSKRRRQVSPQRARALEARFGPQEWWRCLVRDDSRLFDAMGECFGSVHGHEILKRSRAGRTNANLLNMDKVVLLCHHHNGWVENFPIEANELGLADHWEAT